MLYRATIAQYIILGLSILFTIVGASLGKGFENDSHYIPYIIYSISCTSVLFFFYSKGVVGFRDAVSDFQGKLVLPDQMSADDNDEIIVTLESKLKSIQQRLEGYILESALLGGLAFSGFLQILSQNIITFSDLADFGKHVVSSLTHLVHFEGHQAVEVFSVGSSFVDLFA